MACLAGTSGIQVVVLTLSASAGSLLDPTLLLESRPGIVRDFLGYRLGSALNFGAAAVLPLCFRPATDDEAYWVTCNNEGSNPHRTPRGFTSAGLYVAGSEFS